MERHLICVEGLRHQDKSSTKMDHFNSGKNGLLMFLNRDPPILGEMVNVTVQEEYTSIMLFFSQTI